MSIVENSVHSSNKIAFLARRVRALLSLPQNEALFETRGFHRSNSSAQLVLETVGRIFIGGYNAALTARDVNAVLQYVAGVPAAERGFAAEGATMGAAVVDALPFSRPMLLPCVAAFKSEFSYLAHVGAGWALARVPWRRNRILATLDPVHRWLAIDGLGFHDTYFHHRRVLTGWKRERFGYAAHVYDQGVGRAIWFVSGGSVPDATSLISALASTRQGDLWAGLGLATAYAGPVGDAHVISAIKSAGANAAFYAQGVAFACEARALARYVPDHTEMVARAVWSMSAGELAKLVRQARECLPNTETDPPRYQSWRASVAYAYSRTTGEMS